LTLNFSLTYITISGLLKNDKKT